jgi:hypothetical protein
MRQWPSPLASIPQPFNTASQASDFYVSHDSPVTGFRKLSNKNGGKQSETLPRAARRAKGASELQACGTGCRLEVQQGIFEGVAAVFLPTPQSSPYSEKKKTVLFSTGPPINFLEAPPLRDFATTSR